MTRLPLPAPVALGIFLSAPGLRDSLEWTPASLPLIKKIRASLAVYVNYTFFCRAETAACCLTGDLAVDRPSRQIFSLCAQVQRGPSPRHTRQIRIGRPNPCPPRAGGPARLLPPPSYRLMSKIDTPSNSFAGLPLDFAF
jgi:hypothetical protein